MRAPIQTVEDIYPLLRASSVAGNRSRPAMMAGSGCCVLTDWGGTVKVNFVCSAISMAAKAGANWIRAVHQETGAAWWWRSSDK